MSSRTVEMPILSIDRLVRRLSSVIGSKPVERVKIEPVTNEAKPVAATPKYMPTDRAMKDPFVQTVIGLRREGVLFDPNNPQY